MTVTSVSAGSSEFSSSVSSSSTPRLTVPRLLANISWTSTEKRELKAGKLGPPQPIETRRLVIFSHLEAVLIRHELLRLALVDALGRGAGQLRGQGAPCGFAGTFAQVQLRHAGADVVRDEVLQL